MEQVKPKEYSIDCLITYPGEYEPERFEHTVMTLAEMNDEAAIRELVEGVWEVNFPRKAPAEIESVNVRWTYREEYTIYFAEVRLKSGIIIDLYNITNHEGSN